MSRRILAAAAAAMLLGGCTMALREIQNPPESRAVTTGGPATSMIFAARTDAGVVVVDLGWEGDGWQLIRALHEVNAVPEHVVAVFLTHSHRDHIAAWPAVRHARFHLGAAEVPYFVGQKTHEGPIPRVAAVLPSNRPEPGELEIHPFARDTAFAFGSDTVRAFLVPGHTPGSAAYLVDGVLFAGDALSYTRPFGFHAAKRVFSKDAGQARASLRSLFERAAYHRVEFVCTAHGFCARFDELADQLAAGG